MICSVNSEMGAEILTPPQNGDHFLNYFLADDQYCIYVLTGLHLQRTINLVTT